MPSHLSNNNPKLQLVWDSTSLKALQTCARYYQLSILEGYISDSVHLAFGIMFASATETYKKARVDGKDKEEATMLAVKRAMEDSWESPTATCEICQDGHSCTVCELSAEPVGKPWGGHYETLWRCKGETPYKNAKGNKAKCPWAHKGVWNPAPAPDTCGECGSHTEAVRQYVPGDKVKNRFTLIRLVAWYCEEQPEDLNTGFHALKFPDGTPAVELSWKFPLPFVSADGERFILAGHNDSLMTDGQEVFVSDNKTSKAALNQEYFSQFAPNTQMDTYDLAGSILWKDLGFRGILIEAAQTTQGGAKFSSQTFYRTDSQREEYLKEIEFWLKQAELYAKQDYWPMNRANCKMCPFKGVCSKSPETRAMYMQGFNKRVWNPLEER